MTTVLDVMMTKNIIQGLHIIITLILCKWHPEYRNSMIDKGVPLFIYSLSSFILSISIILYLKTTIKDITTSTLNHAVISVIVTYISGIVFFMIAFIYTLWKKLRTLSPGYLWMFAIVLSLFYIIFYGELSYSVGLLYGYVPTGTTYIRVTSWDI